MPRLPRFHKLGDYSFLQTSIFVCYRLYEGEDIGVTVKCYTVCSKVGFTKLRPRWNMELSVLIQHRGLRFTYKFYMYFRISEQVWIDQLFQTLQIYLGIFDISI